MIERCVLYWNIGQNQTFLTDDNTESIEKEIKPGLRAQYQTDK